MPSCVMSHLVVRQTPLGILVHQYKGKEMKIFRFGVLFLLAGILQAEEIVHSVTSPGFVFSPANWVGDQGREGAQFRQTWNPGAYFRFTWESESKDEMPVLLMDDSTYDGSFFPSCSCIMSGWCLDSWP